MTEYTQGCDLDQIDAFTKNTVSLLDETAFNEYGGKNTQVPFDRTLNYIWGSILADTSNIIDKKGANSEDTDDDGIPNVYIEEAGYYVPIKKAVDGKLYADIHNPVKDSSIECVPTNVFVCNEDATLLDNPTTDVTGQSCDILRGVPTNEYIPVGGGVACEFSCIDGKEAQQNCEEIPDCAEVYDAENNECLESGSAVAGIVKEVKTNTTLLWTIMIILVGLGIGVIIFIILDRTRKFNVGISLAISFLFVIV